MLTGHTETLQSLTFDGPLAAWQGIVLGGILAALCFWTLFGVRRDARRKLGSVLFALRVVAIAVLVWLLLGPVRATTFRHFTPKSLAVVTDVSRSMNVVDPPDKQADLRWQSDGTTGSPPSLLSICDRAVSAAALARDQLGWLLRNADPTSQTPRVRSALETSGRAATAAVHLAETFGRLLEEGQATLGPELVSRGKEVASVLVASGVDQIGSLVPRDASGPLVLDRDALDRLEKWHRQLVQSARSLGQLADRVANRLAESNGGSSAAAQRGTESLSRREKVDRLLTAGKTSWFSSRNGTGRIRQYAFDQQTVALADDATPQKGPAPKSENKRRKENRRGHELVVGAGND